MSKATDPSRYGFWFRAAVTSLCLVGLVALADAAGPLYGTARGRLAATLISVMRSREILDNPGVSGYYERLLAKTGSMEKMYIFDRSFRVFRFKPNLTWEHDLVTTNSFGMVGAECTLEKPAGTRRIALLGGSLSSGHMVHADQTYGTLLEKRLNEDHAAGPGERFELLNFACVAYTLTQVLDVAVEDVPRFHPDVYLVDVNELGVYRQWDRHLVQVIQQGIDPKYDFLRETIRLAGASATEDPLVLHGKLAPYRIPVLREVLLRLRDAVARQNASLIVILVPSIEVGDLSKNRVEGIKGLLASLHITVVDLLDTYDGFLDTAPLAAYRGDVHPNARGHALIFQNLYAKLRARPDVWKVLTGREEEARASR
jgi:hypothetical protein